jgi:ArsR family transcriptional regulator
MKRANGIEFLKLAADETRFRILEMLIEGERCVCEIHPKVNRTQSTVSIQLSKLERAGIIESRREGHKVYYRIKDYRVCDLFKALGYKQGACLKNKCCMAE